MCIITPGYGLNFCTKHKAITEIECCCLFELLLTASLLACFDGWSVDGFKLDYWWDGDTYMQYKQNYMMTAAECVWSALNMTLLAHGALHCMGIRTCCTHTYRHTRLTSVHSESIMCRWFVIPKVHLTTAGCRGRKCRRSFCSKPRALEHYLF